MVVDYQKKVAFSVLICLFLLALFLRLGVFFVGPAYDPYRSIITHPDALRYVVLAENLKKYHSFGKEKEDGIIHKNIEKLRSENGTLPAKDENGLRPDAFRLPGYPIFIASLKMIFPDLRFILIVQLLMGISLAIILVMIAQSWGVSEKGAIIAGFLWAIHPALILFDNSIMSESLFLFLTIFSIYLASRTNNVFGIWGVGLFLGASTLVRPLGLLWAPVVLIMFYKRKVGSLLRLLGFFIILCLPILIWSFRNYKAGEGFRLTTVNDINLLFYTGAYTISEKNSEDWFNDWPQQVQFLTNELHSRMKYGEDIIKLVRSYGLELISQNMFVAIRVHMKALFKLLFAHSAGDLFSLMNVEYQPSGILSQLIMLEDTGQIHKITWKNWVAVGWILFNALILILALCGFIKLIILKQWSVVGICALPIILFAIATGSVGLERFRLPIMAPLFILVGSFWNNNKKNSLS